MCTAVSLTKGCHYFGRNLDFENSFGEQVVVTPRNYPFGFAKTDHFAIIGVAMVKNGYPLYFDGVNEAGLGMAGLNFPGNARYNEAKAGKENIASFELIPRILSTCDSVGAAKMALENINITNHCFDKETHPSPLHWIIADKNSAVTVEQTAEELKIYHNPVGVLTNNPTFDFHMTNLANYMSVSAGEAQNRFSDKVELTPHSRGMGGIGLPGDFSSVSRFVKASFVKLNCVCGETEQEKVNSFFRVLDGVSQPKGCVKTENGDVMTHYSSCCNTDKGVYYYTTYFNRNICAVDMHREKLDGEDLIRYDLQSEQKFSWQN
ncbi:MAG: choloylglycine hydrolase [Clostridia bacterium]|nr:choloylglycine hydrolase [Clostridia bacterium]